MGVLIDTGSECSNHKQRMGRTWTDCVPRSDLDVREGRNRELRVLVNASAGFRELCQKKLECQVFLTK